MQNPTRVLNSNHLGWRCLRRPAFVHPQLAFLHQVSEVVQIFFDLAVGFDVAVLHQKLNLSQKNKYD